MFRKISISIRVTPMMYGQIPCKACKNVMINIPNKRRKSLGNIKDKDKRIDLRSKKRIGGQRNTVSSLSSTNIAYIHSLCITYTSMEHRRCPIYI